MVLRIKRASAPQAPVANPHEAFDNPHHGHSPAEESGQPGKLTKALKLGEFTLLPDFDLHNVQGQTKFLVHRTKKGIWYRIIAYDEHSDMLKLTTASGTTFPSKCHRTTKQNYAVALGPSEALQPSPDVLSFVQGLLVKASE